MTTRIGKGKISVNRKPKRVTSLLQRVLGPVLALVIALVFTAVILLLTGKSPVVAFESMFRGAVGNIDGIAETFAKTVPLLLAGLGLTICYRTGLTSIGAEGQIIVGGLVATVVGVYFEGLPRLLIIPVALVFAMIVGGLWAGIAGYLKAKLGVSEVINTIMLNYIAIFFLSYMLDGPMREPPGYYPQSKMLMKEAWLSYIIPGTRMHTGVFMAIFAVFIVYVLLWKLPVGYQMRAVGHNPLAAQVNGINVKRNMVLALFLSGVFAGLAGGVEIMGMHHRLMNGFSSSYGFDAMAVALLGKLNPLGVSAAALFIAALRVGANSMQRTVQVPASLVNVMQGIAILMILMESYLRKYAIRLVRRRNKEDKTAAAKAEGKGA